MNTEITIHPKLQHCGLTTGSKGGSYYRKTAPTRSGQQS